MLVAAGKILPSKAGTQGVPNPFAETIAELLQKTHLDDDHAPQRTILDVIGPVPSAASAAELQPEEPKKRQVAKKRSED